MLGDIILFLKRILKQHIFCIHNYKRYVVDMAEYVFYQCTKCGRIRKKEP
jgi:hypothetical protein